MDEGANSEEWIKALPALRRVLECPVCLEVLKAPVSACRNVHVTCSSCASKTSKCSLCQQPFMQEKPIFVNSLLQVLPHACRYADDGCKEVLGTADSEHEDFCGFRPISCMAVGCDERVILNKMEYHYAKKHFLRAQIKKMHQNDTFCDDSKPDKDTRRSVPVFLEGHFFYITKHYVQKEKCMKIIFEAFPVGSPETNFRVNVKLEKNNVVSHNTIKPIVRKGDSCESGFEIVSEIVEHREDFCVKLSQNMVYQLLDENNKLHFSYTFFTA